MVGNCLLQHLRSVDSTNTFLLRAAAHGCARPSAVFADEQTAGRGRQGRQWVSPARANLYFSLLFELDVPPAEIAGLTLALGLAARRALSAFGVQTQVKWPNDLLANGRKLAGILVELAEKAASGRPSLVAGIGINMHMPSACGSQIGQPWIDLHQLGVPDADAEQTRRALALSMLEHWTQAAEHYQVDRLSTFQVEWALADALYAQALMIEGEGPQHWFGDGIAESGALKVRAGANQRLLHAGEVRICRA